jgi:hypothetical protein
MMFLLTDSVSTNSIVFSLSRIVTLFTLVDFVPGRMKLINRVMKRAYPTVLLMVWTVFMVSLLCSAVIFVFERGTFEVNEDYPDGAFLRPNVLGTAKELSPFTNITVAMYYVIVCMTTTGFGDIVCTTTVGRIATVAILLVSVFILALPVAIIGDILADELTNNEKLTKQRETNIAIHVATKSNAPLIKFRRSMAGTVLKKSPKKNLLLDSPNPLLNRRSRLSSNNRSSSAPISSTLASSGGIELREERPVSPAGESTKMQWKLSPIFESENVSPPYAFKGGVDTLQNSRGDVGSVGEGDLDEQISTLESQYEEHMNQAMIIHQKLWKLTRERLRTEQRVSSATAAL